MKSPSLDVILLSILICGILTAAAPAGAQPIAVGVGYLTDNQQADGSWASAEVRREQVTTETLRALQALGAAPAARLAAADFLELEPVADTDDRARRIGVLAAESRDVTALIEQLRDDVAADGGWGLTARFAADPFDTTLALGAVSPGTAVGDAVVLPALSKLLSVQRADGGWPCVSPDDAPSEIFCTSHALLALAPYRARTLLDSEITAGTNFLRAQLNTDGSFGPPGDLQVIHTALASLALAAVPAFGSELGTVIFFLENQQQADGSWGGDTYPTALALRALAALAAAPFCGSGVIDQPSEACDGGDLGGLTCEDVGLGAGDLACSAQCTLDTSGCGEPPICGDGLRNQLLEVCDGTDLAAETCESLGFASGNLACAADCTSFDVSDCNATASCGDGVVNQPGELCDLSDLGGATCASLDLGGGLLRCAADCGFDTSLCDVASFSIDNIGREFFVGFLLNVDLVSGIPEVHLASDVTTTVRVQYPAVNPTFVHNAAVSPAQVTIVPLPIAVYSAWAAGEVLNNAVRLSAADDFVVYLINRLPYSSDAGLALPVDALGTSHIVTTALGSAFYSGDRSQFLVVAPFDNTTVTITPTTSMLLPGGTTAPPGVPFDVTLDRGEGFRGEATFRRTDLTGTLIESDQPVTVLNGNICTHIPGKTAACDHIFEVAHPVSSWGTSALVTNLPNRRGGSIYRVVASEDNTEVTLNGVPQAILDRGELFEIGPLGGSHEFAADQPIFVTQFMTGRGAPGATLGDPAMVNMIPPDQYLEEYTFATVGDDQFTSHYLTVIAPNSATGSILLDGTAIPASAFGPIGDTGFSRAVLRITEGSHTTSSTSPHGITVEGFRLVDSYIYPGGMRLEFSNPFCGDGMLNQASEECDGNDFGGLTCAAFGFSEGFLKCSTSGCDIDTSQCFGVGSEDDDGDGFPAAEDCDDSDANVHPGMPEILGNDIDDDCNPATPDEIPAEAVSCGLLADQISYAVTDIIGLEAAIVNAEELLSLTGLTVALVVTDGGGSVFSEIRALAPLPPGGRAQQNFVFPALGNAPGGYLAGLTVTAVGESVAACATSFVIDSSAATAAGLAGTLEFDPELVNAGEPSDALYTVKNLGNAALVDLGIRVLLLDPETGEILGELDDSVSLDPEGGSYSAAQPISTEGLESNRTYLAVLIAVLGVDFEQTLDEALLTVVNAPPDCSGAFADPGDLWPPNHKLVEVEIQGVTDPDDDPVTLVVEGVLQDERTAALGSGDTCPDATGLGTPRVSVRAERSGQQDGRVYHLFFTADDGRGASCEGEVTVCVPHDRRPGATCFDQGALYDSTVCP